MKLTNRQVAEAFQALQLLPALPIRQSFLAAKLKNILRPLTEVIEETRISLVKEYSLKDSDATPKQDEKGNLTIPAADIAAFQSEFKKLMAIENEISWTDKIKLPETLASTCDKCHHNMSKTLEIDSNILAALDWVLEV